MTFAQGIFRSLKQHGLTMKDNVKWICNGSPEEVEEAIRKLKDSGHIWIITDQNGDEWVICRSVNGRVQNAKDRTA